jgi:hypothetical protein
MKKAISKTLSRWLAGVWVIRTTGCGHYPSYLTSLHDLDRTSRLETHVRVSGPPTENFAALSKFQNLYEIDIDGGGTDDQLEVLVKNKFSNLSKVVLTDCPLVTEIGILSLLRITTLKGLGLRGTSMLYS